MHFPKKKNAKYATKNKMFKNMQNNNLDIFCV